MRLDAPHPGHQWSFGRLDLEDGADASDWPSERLYAPAGSNRLKAILEHVKGLMCVVLGASPAAAADPLRHPAVRSGLHYRWLYHIDIAFLRRQPGVRVVAVAGGIGHHVVDDGLKEHGYWSALRKQEAEGTPRAEWLKPLLLTSYGLFAARPSPRAGASLRAAGEHRPYIGPQGDQVPAVRWTTVERQPQTANLVWLGLIQHWTWVETLTYAQTLRAAGCRVLACYVDSVLIEAGRPWPARNLWCHQATLSHVTLSSEQDLVSDEYVRLPGLTGRERARKEDEIRARAEFSQAALAALQSRQTRQSEPVEGALRPNPDARARAGRAARDNGAGVPPDVVSALRRDLDV
jgi:hypothetical protein